MGALAPTHYQSLLPTLGPEAMERAEGSLDHVPDVTQGQKTALNTREYRYAHFFNRVKREVAARWRAGEVYQATDPQGNVYGVRDRHTVVSVTLYPNGALAELEILSSSGVRALDLEALNAFQRAQPFHNPPKGLIDADGKIRFKFGFFLEISGGGFRFLP
jgi:TonB family protein